MYERLAQLRKNNGLSVTPTTQNKKDFEDIMRAKMLPECTGHFSHNSSNFNSYNERCTADFGSDCAFR